MPSISEKGMAMPASPIRKLVPYADEAKARGVKVYHLNIGQPDIKTPEIALEAIKNYDERVIAYSHSAGNASYRNKLAKSYQDIGLDVKPEDILITTGGSEAITMSFMTTCNEGDEVIIPEPFYANYNGFAISSGVKIVPITASVQNDFALPPISEFEKLITPKTRGILICNPNNPTGYLYTREELETLAKLVKKYDLYLYADEVYREFCYDGNEHYSVLQIEEIKDNVIMMDSVSKRYSMCGVRVGCIVSKNQEFICTALKFAQARLCPPSLGQVASEAALDVSPDYFKEVYDEYIARRNFTVEKLNAMEGVYSPMPKGAFYTTVKLPIDDADKFAQWLLEDFQYKNQTVMLAPATGFYNTHGMGKNEVRIAYVLKIEDLEKAMETLNEALKVYPGRTL